jgi:hypothetical protein
VGDGAGGRSAPSPASTSLRYLTVYSLDIEVEAVHDEPPDYFAELLVADINEALRARGLDDALVTAWSCRDPTTLGSPSSGTGCGVARPGAAEWWPGSAGSRREIRGRAGHGPGDGARQAKRDPHHDGEPRPRTVV